MCGRVGRGCGSRLCLVLCSRSFSGHALAPLSTILAWFCSVTSSSHSSITSCSRDDDQTRLSIGEALPHTCIKRRRVSGFGAQAASSPSGMRRLALPETSHPMRSGLQAAGFASDQVIMRPGYKGYTQHRPRTPSHRAARPRRLARGAWPPPRGALWSVVQTSARRYWWARTPPRSPPSA